MGARERRDFVTTATGKGASGFTFPPSAALGQSALAERGGTANGEAGAALPWEQARAIVMATGRP